MKDYGGYRPAFPKQAKKPKKAKKPLSRRSKKKMDDGRKDLENECMDLWRMIVSHGKTVCEWCRKPHFVYQCHHIFSKGGSKALKFEPTNGIYLGKGCHLAAHNDRSNDFHDFIVEYLGQSTYDVLKLRKNNRVDHSLNGLKTLKIGLQQEIEQLKKKMV